MKIVKTSFEGLIVIEADVYADTRGYFFESFNGEVFRKAGIDFNCLQENQSFSKKNVIRGLHFQRPPYAQSKLIRVAQGRILDVVVDLRKGEPTFGKSFSVELSSGEKKQLLVPRGFAHGFSVLSDSAEVIYCCDNYYAREFDAGILHSDPALEIDWKVSTSERIVSEKDRLLPTFASNPHFFEGFELGRN